MGRRPSAPARADFGEKYREKQIRNFPPEGLHAAFDWVADGADVPYPPPKSELYRKDTQAHRERVLSDGRPAAEVFGPKGY